jgi:elongation factor P hydroxylase
MFPISASFWDILFSFRAVMASNSCIEFVRQLASAPMNASDPAISADVVADVFNDCFFSTEATLLVGGAVEPFFAPGSPAQIHFREDFVRSALHEVAHWCVAGARRRRLPDYGYWYAPEGRTGAQQAAFFSVEARPQAIESIFCDACGVDFSPSVDNVEGNVSALMLKAFFTRIARWRSHFHAHGLPARAALFCQCLNRACAQREDRRVTHRS